MYSEEVTVAVLLLLEEERLFTSCFKKGGSILFYLYLGRANTVGAGEGKGAY